MCTKVNEKTQHATILNGVVLTASANKKLNHTQKVGIEIAMQNPEATFAPGIAHILRKEARHDA